MLEDLPIVGEVCVSTVTHVWGPGRVTTDIHVIVDECRNKRMRFTVPCDVYLTEWDKEKNRGHLTRRDRA